MELGNDDDDDGRASVDEGTVGTSSDGRDAFETFYKAVFAEEPLRSLWISALEHSHHPLPMVIRPLLDRNLALAQGAEPPASALTEDLRNVFKSIAAEVAEVPGGSNVRAAWLSAWRSWEIKRAVGQSLKSWHTLTQLLYHAEKTAECVVQELVSMLPVLLLEPRPSEAICDLCSAPGGKSIQILEALSKSAGNAQSGRGLLVANELCPKRADALRVRMQFVVGSLSQHCIVTNCNAAIFPTLHSCERIRDCERTQEEIAPTLSASQLEALSKEEYATDVQHWCQSAAASSSGKKADVVPWYRRRKLKFHRILVDAPCSGDGTMRKNADIYERWSATKGLGNFPRQLAILRRALELLHEGGRCVYSTCSMSPVECEAVVSAALVLHNTVKAKQGGGFVVLEDAHAILPRVTSVPLEAFQRGLTDWSVPSPSFSASDPVMYQSWDEVPNGLRSKRSKVRNAVAAETKAPKQGVKLRAEMFAAPAKENGIDTSRCVRVFPGAHIDSGCFFSAVITKVAAKASCTDGTTDETLKWQAWADCRFAFPRVKANLREVPAVLHFFGLFENEAEAAENGVQRFPLEQVGWAPKSGKKAGGNAKASWVLLSKTGLDVQYHGPVSVKGGGLPLFERMDDVCSWAQNAGLSETRDFFTWRPSPGAGAALLSKCCTRRRLCLPFHLLRRLLEERRLLLSELVGCKDVSGLEKCGTWAGREAIVSAGKFDETQLVPGGVLVVPNSGAINGALMPEAAMAFAALLSRTELLVLGSNDYRERCLELLDRASLIA